MERTLDTISLRKSLYLFIDLVMSCAKIKHISTLFLVYIQ